MMKILNPLVFALGLSLAAAPAFAQSSGGATGNAPVAGEGPGGSGAGQPAAGPSKTSPSAPTSDGSSMMMKKPATGAGADPTKPAGSSTAD